MGVLILEKLGTVERGKKSLLDALTSYSTRRAPLSSCSIPASVVAPTAPEPRESAKACPGMSSPVGPQLVIQFEQHPPWSPPTPKMLAGGVSPFMVWM